MPTCQHQGFQGVVPLAELIQGRQSGIHDACTIVCITTREEAATLLEASKHPAPMTRLTWIAVFGKQGQQLGGSALSHELLASHT